MVERMRGAELQLKMSQRTFTTYPLQESFSNVRYVGYVGLGFNSTTWIKARLVDEHQHAQHTKYSLRVFSNDDVDVYVGERQQSATSRGFPSAYDWGSLSARRIVYLSDESTKGSAVEPST
ncbi:hypothetical protein KQX54_003693 [Cotesia glomerata]|uniref:Uncharacterized protein n=1 Tax=Cotesia glomerata TaxID=32391 RepID=A0AAV7HV93_COTGL|nr:hypothetical protein KQX54_003693 [Cotesia glomerata]